MEIGRNQRPDFNDGWEFLGFAKFEAYVTDEKKPPRKIAVGTIQCFAKLSNSALGFSFFNNFNNGHLFDVWEKKIYYGSKEKTSCYLFSTKIENNHGVLRIEDLVPFAELKKDDKTQKSKLEVTFRLVIADKKKTLVFDYE